MIPARQNYPAFGGGDVEGDQLHVEHKHFVGADGRREPLDAVGQSRGEERADPASDSDEPHGFGEPRNDAIEVEAGGFAAMR